MKMALAFHKIDRDNCIEFLKTSFIGIVSHWFMGLKDTNKNRILYGENNDRNENFDKVLNRFENEIRKEFLGEDWEIDFQQEIKRKRMENVMKLTRLEICNICYFEKYTCSFEQFYYKCEFDKD